MPTKSRAFLSLAAIICLGVLVYSNTFFSSFHFDDDAYIINNFAIRNIHHLFDIWKICPCRFLTFLTLALNYHFNGFHVLGYHLVNLAIHLASAILVWWLLLLTFSTPVLKDDKISRHADLMALLAALVFVSHPLQTEAVTYIWQRAASLTAFFYLLSLCLYIKSRLQNSTPFYILSLLSAIAAMFTKENAITLPLMIVLYEFFFFKSKKGFNWLSLYPFWMILFIIPQTMVLTKTARLQEIESIVGGPHGISPLNYLLTQFRVIITYIRLLILPIHLNLDYDYPIFQSFFQLPVFSSFLCLAAILYFAKRMFVKYRLISFSIGWFFLTLLPESSILPQTDVIFEHRLYLPMVGYCLFLVSGIFYLGAKKTTKVLVIILSLIIAFNSILTYQRNKIWTNELDLWQDIVQKSPHKARPYINRGWAFYNAGNFNQAMADYDKAIAISPDYIYPYDDKGLILSAQGKLAQAIDQYNQSIKINPYYAKVYFHRGQSYLKMNNEPAALADFNKALELDDEYVDAYNARGDVYKAQGNWPKAKWDYTKSLSIDPDQPLTHK